VEAIDNPNLNDNRDYDYSSTFAIERAEYPVITKMIAKNSRVIDLGCGNGSLLENLIKEKNVIAKGIEFSKSGVDICKKKGLDVVEARIDTPMPYADNEFDYAICNVTIQMVMFPERLIKEMKRIAKYQIVSFPNFGFIKNRLDLLFKGRMPRPMLFGYTWYSTGHIHQLTNRDFNVTCREFGLKILETKSVTKGSSIISYLASNFPNLFSPENIYLLQKNN